MDYLINYIKLHITSLEQDAEELDKQMGFYDDLDCDEYKDLEIEDIFNNGQIAAMHHILQIALDYKATLV
jgi:hypothetical protein